MLAEGGSSSSLLKDARRHKCVAVAQPHPWDMPSGATSVLKMPVGVSVWDMCPVPGKNNLAGRRG